VLAVTRPSPDRDSVMDCGAAVPLSDRGQALRGARIANSPEASRSQCQLDQHPTESTSTRGIEKEQRFLHAPMLSKPPGNRYSGLPRTTRAIWRGRNRLPGFEPAVRRDLERRGPPSTPGPQTERRPLHQHAIAYGAWQESGWVDHRATRRRVVAAKLTDLQSRSLRLCSSPHDHRKWSNCFRSMIRSTPPPFSTRTPAPQFSGNTCSAPIGFHHVVGSDRVDGCSALRAPRTGSLVRDREASINHEYSHVRSQNRRTWSRAASTIIPPLRNRADTRAAGDCHFRPTLR
jgi:hypothetical protein